jgi:hypothetical protein
MAELPRKVETRIGDLFFDHDYPTNPTVQRLYDTMDFQRACQLYLWALPIVGVARWRQAYRETWDLQPNEAVLTSTFQDRLGVLTLNETTPYLFGFTNVAERPVVFDVPPGMVIGLAIDFWQQSLFDMGVFGVNEGEGGRYVVVGPSTPERPDVEGATLIESSTDNVCFVFRLAGTPEQNQAAMDGVKVHYLGDEPSFDIIDMAGKNSGMMHQPRGLAFWKLLHEVLQEEPVAERDRFFMYWLTHLGIEKGERFDPDTRQRAILEEASLVGESMAQAMVFDERHPGVLMYDGWRLVLGGERGDGIHETQRMEHWDTFDPRARYTYEAICTSEVMTNPEPGRGMAYMAVFQDKNREWLKGEFSYRLRVPKDVPASLFWSAVCYDNRTRTLIETDQQHATVGLKTEGLIVNDDGSVDVFFGPESPGPEREVNWVKTIPGRGWFVYFRLYGVEQAFFDKTWQLPLVEPVDFQNLGE